MDNYFDYFDKIYFINSLHRVDRYNNVMEMFSKLNITNYKQIIPIDASKFIQIGDFIPTAQSCKDAHLRCYKDAVENNYSKVCIFEDDFCFNESIDINDIESYLIECFTFLKNFDWDMFYFDNVVDIEKYDYLVKVIHRYKVDNLISPIVKIKGKTFAHSYALSNYGCRRMIYEHTTNNLWNDRSLCNSNITKKYLYIRGLFDQLTNNKSDHAWNTTK